jgi:hypothetical protein
MQIERMLLEEPEKARFGISRLQHVIRAALLRTMDENEAGRPFDHGEDKAAAQEGNLREAPLSRFTRWRAKMTDHIGFNQNHPELRPGEVFLQNDANNGFSRVKAVLPSARQGEIAYNIDGGELAGEMVKPIFVDPDELEEIGGHLMVEVAHFNLQNQRT